MELYLPAGEPLVLTLFLVSVKVARLLVHMRLRVWAHGKFMQNYTSMKRVENYELVDGVAS